VHAGAQTKAEILGQTPKGPSPMRNIFGEETAAMSRQDIDTVIDSFAKAAGRARQAGFDAVQIHAAHGYLVSQFLSPYCNQRDDEYGGSSENRARLLLEIYRAVRETVGNNYPLLIKINCRDFLEPEFTLQEMIAVCKQLEQRGLDAVELSGGMPFSAPKSPTRTGKAGRTPYHLDYAREFKKHLDMPVILVGGVRSFEDAETILDQGHAEFIAMSRPLIREPHLARRWQNGDHTGAACISCNMCFKGAIGGKGLYCAIDAGEVSEEEAAKA
jgi:2,4-dienoyl-CoA reductase-like NADH-dependent reductase (Old Yellow Enzyme family)